MALIRLFCYDIPMNDRNYTKMVVSLREMKDKIDDLIDSLIAQTLTQSLGGSDVSSFLSAYEMASNTGRFSPQQFLNIYGDEYKTVWKSFSREEILEIFHNSKRGSSLYQKALRRLHQMNRVKQSL